MQTLYQVNIFLICSETRVNLVIVRRSITMVRTFTHIIFEHRCHPKSRNTQLGQIINMAFHTGKVATMTGGNIRTVDRVRILHLHFVITHVAIGKTVGHHQIYDIRRVEAFLFRRTGLTSFQLILIADFLFSFRKFNREFTRQSIFHIQIDKQIVRTFYTLHTLNLHTAISDFRGVGTDIGAINHQLKFTVVHSTPPERRVDTFHLFRILVCQQEQQR